MGNKQTTISTIHKISYSAGNFSVNLMAQTFATYIVFYYVDTLKVSPALIGLAMLIHGIFNAVLNPIFGYISDRTQTRWGRRIPYIAIATIPLAAIFTLIWFPLVSGDALFWYFLIVVFVYDILFVMVVLNWTSLFPEMFTSLKERASASSWRQMLGILGMILGVAIAPILYSSFGWGGMGLIFGGCIVLFLFISLYGSKENREIQVGNYRFLDALKYTLGNRSFLTYVIGSFFVQISFAIIPAVLPFFTKYVLKLPASNNSIIMGGIFIMAIPMVYVWGALAKKYGSKRIIKVAIGFYIVSLVPFAFVQSFYAAIATTAAVGFGLAGIIVLLDVLLADIIDQDEVRTGERREGMYFGMNGFIVRWGVSVKAIILGSVLSYSGYVADTPVQSSFALSGIRMMLSAIPILFLLISLFFFFLHSNKTNKEHRTVVEGREVGK